MIIDITKALKDLKQRYPTDNFIFGGDFNMVIDEWLDRSPSNIQGIIIIRFYLTFVVILI